MYMMLLDSDIEDGCRITTTIQDMVMDRLIHMHTTEDIMVGIAGITAHRMEGTMVTLGIMVGTMDGTTVMVMATDGITDMVTEDMLEEIPDSQPLTDTMVQEQEVAQVVVRKEERMDLEI